MHAAGAAVWRGGVRGGGSAGGDGRQRQRLPGAEVAAGIGSVRKVGQRRRGRRMLQCPCTPQVQRGSRATHARTRMALGGAGTTRDALHGRRPVRAPSRPRFACSDCGHAPCARAACLRGVERSLALPTPLPRLPLAADEERASNQLLHSISLENEMRILTLSAAGSTTASGQYWCRPFLAACSRATRHPCTADTVSRITLYPRSRDREN